MVFAAALLMAGCGSSGDGVPVTGKVTFRGQTFSNASITFYPVNGRPVYSSITDGTYSVNLRPGEYRVAISLGVNLPEGWKEGDPIPPREVQLPPKYSDVRGTPLTITVSEDQAEPVNFDLQ